MPDARADLGGELTAPRTEYARRLDARLKTHASLDTRHQWVGYTRAVAAIAGIGMLVAFFLGTDVGPVGRPDRVPFSGWWLLAPLPVLVFLGQWLDRLEAASAAVSRSIRFYERGLARIDGNWAGTGTPGTRFFDEHHIYASDLDLFGRGSLFDLICNARTPMGEDTLAGWLLNPASPEVVRRRQEAVRDLSARVDFLERLATTAGKTRRDTGSASLAKWSAQPLELQAANWRMAAWGLTVLGALAIAAIVTYLTATAGIVILSDATLTTLRVYFVPAVLVVSIVYRRFKRDTERILGQAESATAYLSLIEQAAIVIETEAFQAPQLVMLHDTLVADSVPASSRIVHLRRLMTIADSRRNWFVKLAGPLLLFDFHIACRIEDWRRVSGPSTVGWLEAIGETEALASLASYSFCRPEHTFPEFAAETTGRLEATAIGHPLLYSSAASAGGVVTNDVSIVPPLQVLIVSGSNMSGKSTLLRTLGINVVLAQAGAPVFARRMALSPLALGTSIRIQDSLQEGVSRFYAEIQRLRQIVDAARDHAPLVFLIDEFLHGTNSHDRLIGATAIVRGLVERGAIGLVTTHDLALTHIAEDLGARASNVHFQDEMKDGRLSYDYVMRPGIVTRSNAIELMRSVGLEI